MLMGKNRAAISYHYLQHMAEELGVLCHSANEELPGEDGRVVILILHLDEHLGCVSCKKQMAPTYISVHYVTSG